MPNGGNQGVAQHFLKYHTDLNVRIRIRTLKVLPGADKNPPDFMTLLNHAAPLTQEQRQTILDALSRAVARGDKLFTGVAKENLDMMFTKLIIHEDLHLNAYTRVQQVTLDTDPLMWWKQHVKEFPRLARMTRQHLAVPATSASPERLFSSVGLVKSDLRGSLLDTTLIDVMWVKQAP
jgi:hypothetical protein